MYPLAGARLMNCMNISGVSNGRFYVVHDQYVIDAGLNYNFNLARNEQLVSREMTIVADQ